MLRLNLFTEVRTMESVLDERTELDTLHRFYDYITGSMRLMGLPIYLLVLVCLNRSDAMPVRLLGSLVVAVLFLWLLGWPWYQLYRGLFRLDLSTRKRGFGAPGAGSLAVYVIFGGMFLPIVVDGFTQSQDGALGLFFSLLPLGMCLVYAALALAHNLYVRGQGPEYGAALPPCKIQNRVAAAAFALLLALGIWAAATNPVLRGTLYVEDLRPLQAAYQQLDAQAVYENDVNLNGEHFIYTGYDMPLTPGQDRTLLLVYDDGTAWKQEDISTNSNNWSVSYWQYAAGQWIESAPTGLELLPCFLSPYPSILSSDISAWSVEPQPGGGAVYRVTYNQRYWERRSGRQFWAGSPCVYTVDADGQLVRFDCESTVEGRRYQASSVLTAQGAAAARQMNDALAQLG